MNKLFRFSLPAFVLTLAFVFVGHAFAQEEKTSDDTYLTPEEYLELHPEELERSEDSVDENAEMMDWGSGEGSGDGVSCFDYYTFQSVKVDFTKNHDVFGPDETIHFKGVISNENRYPVVDGVLFARVSRVNENFGVESNYIVDEFDALENVTLDANAKKEVSFDWKAPRELTPGKYQVDYFFSVGKKFNLGGLPFSNEVTIGFDNFKVVSDDTSYMSFDLAGTKVNGEKYLHIGNWPVVSKGEKATILQPIKSTFPEDEQIRITYGLYYWDSLNEGDLIETKEDMKMVPASGTLDLSYVIPEMKETVYMLKITAKWREQKSIVNIRILSDGEKPRLNYPAITKFPLKQGDDFTLFSCFHNTSNANTKGKVVVELFDKDDSKVGEMEYEGDISGAMMADKTDLKANKDYDYLKLDAKMYDKDNKLVDQYQTVYNKCKIVDCTKKDNIPVEQNNNPESRINILYVVMALLVLALLALLAMKLNVKKKEDAPVQANEENNENTI